MWVPVTVSLADAILICILLMLWTSTLFPTSTALVGDEESDDGETGLEDAVLPFNVVVGDTSCGGDMSCAGDMSCGDDTAREDPRIVFGGDVAS